MILGLSFGPEVLGELREYNKSGSDVKLMKFHIEKVIHFLNPWEFTSEYDVASVFEISRGPACVFFAQEKTFLLKVVGGSIF